MDGLPHTEVVGYSRQWFTSNALHPASLGQQLVLDIQGNEAVVLPLKRPCAASPPGHDVCLIGANRQAAVELQGDRPARHGSARRPGIGNPGIGVRVVPGIEWRNHWETVRRARGESRAEGRDALVEDHGRGAKRHVPTVVDGVFLERVRDDLGTRGHLVRVGDRDIDV